MGMYSNERVEGFLHTDGRSMRNGRGEEVRLRGWAAGQLDQPGGLFVRGRAPPLGDGRPGPGAGPLRPRPQHRGQCAAAVRQRLRERLLAPLVPQPSGGGGSPRHGGLRLQLGAAAAERAGLFARGAGFAWNEDSFAMLDEVLGWCEKYRLYAILDLHTAPGGQSGIKCDDGLKSMPLFFLEEESMERSIRLWEEIARRYKDRWIVGGYDLLNEPVAPCEWFQLIPQLAAYYDRLIPRLRAIDKTTCSPSRGRPPATNMEIFDHNYDPKCNNWCIHVHFYGLSPERRSLFRYLEPSLRLNVPVWLGEGGGPARTSRRCWRRRTAWGWASTSGAGRPRWPGAASCAGTRCSTRCPGAGTGCWTFQRRRAAARLYRVPGHLRRDAGEHEI